MAILMWPANLTFAAANWLWLLPPAVALPAVIHWLTRRRSRPMVFPAARLVAAQTAGTSPPRRWRQWVLMALRMALLVALIAGFAQPRWAGQSKSSSTEKGGTHWAVLVDRSASMRRARQGARLYDRVRRQAIERLHDLQGKSPRVSVILVDERPEPLLPEPTRNVEALIQRLKNTAVTYQRGRLAAAVQRARRMHTQQSARAGGRLALAIYTDAQKTHWPDQVLNRLRQGGTRIEVHRVKGAAANLALTGLRLDPARPVRNQPVRITATLKRYAGPATPVTVRLRGESLDPRPASRQLTPAAGETAQARWRLRFTREGWGRVRAQLGQHTDALPGDDALGRAVNVAKAQPVVLATAVDTTSPETAGYFLKRALAPGREGAASGLTVRIVRARDLPEALLDQAPRRAGAPRPIVVLVEAGRLSEASRATLTSHLDQGGGLLWWVDSRQAARAYNRFVEALHRSPADAPRGSVVEAGGNPTALPRAAWQGGTDSAAALGSARFERGPLAVFQGPARAGLLGTRFARYARLEGGAEADVLLTGKAGQPLLTDHAVGEGRLIVGGLDLSPAGSSLVKTPWLVVLLHELVRSLRPPSSERALVLPGQALPWQPRTDHQVLGPGGNSLAGSGEVIARQPGWHQWLAEGGDVQAQRWVRWPVSESDLTPADVAQDAAKDAASRAIALHTGGAGSRRRTSENHRLGADSRHNEEISSTATDGNKVESRSGGAPQPLWPWCIALVLIVLTVEPLVRMCPIGRLPRWKAAT